MDNDGKDIFYKRRRDSYDEMPTVVGHGYPNRAFDNQNTQTAVQQQQQQHPLPFIRPVSFHEEETFEESFKEEIEVERTRRPNSFSSQESILINEHFNKR